VDILAVTDNTCVAALTKLHGDDAKADELQVWLGDTMLAHDYKYII